MNNIELHIEQLVLHGFRHSARYSIGKAVELELTRLLTERNVSPSLTKGGDFSRLDGGTINIAPSSKSDAIGTQVAQSVYENMNASKSRKER